LGESGAWQAFDVRAHLLELLPPVSNPDREALGAIGDKLAGDSRGMWMVQAVEYLSEPGSRVVVDSVRREVELAALRRTFGSRLLHLFLTANEEVLLERYRGRKGDPLYPVPYEMVVNSKSEAQLPNLQAKADVVVDTSELTLLAVAKIAVTLTGDERGD